MSVLATLIQNIATIAAALKVLVGTYLSAAVLVAYIKKPKNGTFVISNFS
jgi:hypothetical protein